MLRRMDGVELTHWRAFMRVNPLGEERADLRAGIIAATIANGKRKKGSRAFRPKEFMPNFRKRFKGQTPDEQAAIFRAFVAFHNNRVKGG
jgi:hypothetical protein